MGPDRGEIPGGAHQAPGGNREPPHAHGPAPAGCPMIRTLLALATVFVAIAIAGAPASAGTYQVGACGAPMPLINNSWQPFNNNPTYLETSTNCGGEDVTGGSPRTSGLAAADVLRLSTNVPAGATVGWQVAAPSGDMISAISMNRDLFDN